jgi:hypothetical protein
MVPDISAVVRAGNLVHVICHQAIFVDQATVLSLSSDAVQAGIDRLG